MTNHNFSFRTDRYDFWSIYEAIKKYYPIGISESLEESFPGRKEKEKLIVENIHQPENYKSRWEDNPVLVYLGCGNIGLEGTIST